MKRFLCFLMVFITILLFASCNSDKNSITLRTGTYYAVGDYEEFMVPYLYLDTTDNTFSLGESSLMSYAENGIYEIIDDVILATAQDIKLKFKIKDKNTLILIDNGDYDVFEIPVNTEFVFSEDLK